MLLVSLLPAIYLKPADSPILCSIDRYEDKFGRAAADAICKEIVTDCWTYNRDPKAIRKQRKIILEGLAGK